MTNDPNFINDPQRQLEANLDKIGERYSSSHKRSRTENKERADIRARAKELGLRTDAFQTGIKIVKDLTENERKDFLRDLDLIVRVFGAKQSELFPDEALKAEQRVKRQAERAAKEGRTKEELDAASDSNSRSDPSAGGAQIDLEDAIAAATDPVIPDGGVYNAGAGKPSLEEIEAAEGEAALADAAPETTKQSQSAKAQARKNAAGIP